MGGFWDESPRAQTCSLLMALQGEQYSLNMMITIVILMESNHCDRTLACKGSIFVVFYLLFCDNNTKIAEMILSRKIPNVLQCT